MKLWKIIAAALLSMSAGLACAQAYPTKPVRVIIPYPPGEAADFIARVIGPTLSERMGQQFVVENRAGASGQIGMELLKNAPADGYTIGIGQGGTLSLFHEKGKGRAPIHHPVHGNAAQPVGLRFARQPPRFRVPLGKERLFALQHGGNGRSRDLTVHDALARRCRWLILARHKGR